jgi:hypothetical protein
VDEFHQPVISVRIPHKVFFAIYNLMSLTIGVKDGQAIIGRLLGEFLRNTITAEETTINLAVQNNMVQIKAMLETINQIPREIFVDFGSDGFSIK